MDVEKMRKINELARELKEKGITLNTEEAYKQAEQMVEGNMDVPEATNTENSESMAEMNESMKQTENRSSEPSLSGTVNLDALESHNLNERLNSMEEQLNVMFTKINEIVSEVNNMQKKKQESPIEVRELKDEKKEESQKDFQSRLKEEQEEGHPRTGDYKSEDVSIEKMFYFGR